MPQFLEAMENLSRWRMRAASRRSLPPRAWINPKDFQNGKAPGTAYAAPEYPKFAPPDWQAGLVEYVSEQECEQICRDFIESRELEAWQNFSFEYGRELHRARAERIRQRKIRRNKRAFHFWSGYVAGFVAAVALARRFFHR